MKLSKNQLLFFTIFLEGYVVLACELIAIRTLIPFVGSGTEVISIIISAVLLPLAIGYHIGGQRYQKAQNKNGKAVSIRKILLRNLLSALLPLTFGLSYVFQEIFFGLIEMAGIEHHILQTGLFCIIFLVYPVYLLAQTIPLLSNYFSSRTLSSITGKMLAFSTLGSFGGSVISTIILMTTIGVHYTLIFTLGLLVLVVLLLSRRWYNFDNVMALFFLGIAWLMNSGAMMDEMNIVANNQYGMTKIYQESDDVTVMDINRSYSSSYSADPKKRFAYLQFIENNFINPSIKNNEKLKILVIGAGGFTVGVDDKFNEYTYVDIDASLKETAEKHLLPEPLGPNKNFKAISARAFLTRDDTLYDMIIIDAFTSIRSIPMEVVTKEFLLECQQQLAKNGVVISNIISAPKFTDAFTRRYYNTFQSVFPHFLLIPMHPLPNVWGEKPSSDNTLYVYFNSSVDDDDTVYTDNLNTYSLDR